MKIIKELTEACDLLYTYAPAEVASNMEQLVQEVIHQLEKDQFYIQCLENGGVDNWDWFSESLRPYWEKYGD